MQVLTAGKGKHKHFVGFELFFSTALDAGCRGECREFYGHADREAWAQDRFETGCPAGRVQFCDEQCEPDARRQASVYAWWPDRGERPIGRDHGYGGNCAGWRRQWFARQQCDLHGASEGAKRRGGNGIAGTGAGTDMTELVNLDYAGFMTSFHQFLTELLTEGRVVFRSARAPQDRPRAEDIALLERAYNAFRLSVAGPEIAFDPAIGYSAAELVRQASWALVNHDDQVSHLKKCLTMPIQPVTAAHHLSGDLMLRYLPQVLKRARGLDPTDPLISLLEAVLRAWPLSGVLSDGAEGPTGPRDLGGHPGLLLLYAERLAANDRPAWRPVQSDPGWDYYELVKDVRARRESQAEAIVPSPFRRCRKRGSRWMMPSTACAGKSSSRSSGGSLTAMRSST